MTVIPTGPTCESSCLANCSPLYYVSVHCRLFLIQSVQEAIEFATCMHKGYTYKVATRVCLCAVVVVLAFSTPVPFIQAIESDHDHNNETANIANFL